MPHHFILILLPILAIVDPARPSTPKDDPLPRYEATDRYEVRQIEGWTVLVNKGFLERDADLSGRALALLGHQLAQVARRLPVGALKSLREVHIWVEEAEPHHPCMAYHPDPKWLRDHDMNPEKARCVEIANARHFLSWVKDQPWMLLHELAPAYHHQTLPGGFENEDIRAAFDRATRAKLYESVLHINGKMQRGYAATDPMEYFAESSEAFFGTNDFFPFVSAELRRHDPEMADLLLRLWGGR
jgi:hypothetical protein